MAIENGKRPNRGDRLTYDVKSKTEMTRTEMIDRLAPDGTKHE
jgi:hypothetical protein